MGMNTINGDDILKMRMYEPRVGIWHADIDSDTDTDITKGTAVTIELENGLVTFTGTVFRGGIESGRWMGRIVGGAGGLRTEVAAKYYQNATFGVVLAELMTASGETLNTLTDSAITLHQRARWWRARGKVSHEIKTIVDLLNRSEGDPGYIFRMQRDGTLFLGVDTFAVLEFQHEELDRKQNLSEVVIAPLQAPSLLPGVTFNGERIDYVLTDLVSESLRQRYWVQNP